MKERRSTLERVGRFIRQKPLGAFGAFIVLAMAFLAIFADLISPYDPTEVHPEFMKKPPSWAFPFGTDGAGRDQLSRVIYGSRISLLVGFLSVIFGTMLGAFLGIISGYFGGNVDLIIQRLMDMILAFPILILALAIVAMLGASLANVIVALAIVIMPGVSRVVRGSVLSIKENQYVEAARTVGVKELRMILVHIFPNVTAPIIVLATINLGTAIITEASLSFLGLGPPPPTPTWGAMLSGGRAMFEKTPWLAIFPGAAISLSVLGFNLFGDALRDIWDPRLRGEGR